MNRQDYDIIKDLMLRFLINVDHVSRRQRTENILKKLYEFLKIKYETKKENSG